jgi:hypothetical protein
MVLAGLVVNTVDALRIDLYPWPDGTNPDDIQSLKLAVHALPAMALLLVLAGCVAGAAAGAYAASQFSGRAAKWPGVAVAVLVLGASVTTVLLPYPTWVWVLAFVLVPAAGVAASQLAMRHPGDADPM